MLDGAILGIITWLSFVLSWRHLPQIIKKLTFKVPLITDIGATVLAFLLLSGISKSITAVIGSMITGLLINFTLIIGKQHHERNV
jgi:hypothetical protein